MLNCVRNILHIINSVLTWPHSMAIHFSLIREQRMWHYREWHQNDLGVIRTSMSKSCTSRGCINGISIYPPRPSDRYQSGCFLKCFETRQSKYIMKWSWWLWKSWHRWNPDAAIKNSQSMLRMHKKIKRIYRMNTHDVPIASIAGSTGKITRPHLQHQSTW